jgi:hypothetical protein
LEHSGRAEFAPPALDFRIAQRLGLRLAFVEGGSAPRHFLRGSRKREEHGRVDRIGLAAGDDFGSIDGQRGAMAAVRRRAVKARSQRTDAPGRRGLPQRSEREVSGRVGGRRVLAVVSG